MKKKIVLSLLSDHGFLLIDKKEGKYLVLDRKSGIPTSFQPTIEGNLKENDIDKKSLVFILDDGDKIDGTRISDLDWKDTPVPQDITGKIV